MEIHWLGPVLGLIGGMAVAGVWYGKLFLAVWWRLTGITPEQSKQASRKNMVQLLIANAVTVAGLTVGIGITRAATNNDSVWLALLVGLVAWLAFSASTLLQHNAFELKPPKLTLINTSYQLALFLTMSLLIGVF